MRIIVLGSFGPSLTNFRGPLLARLVSEGHEVFAAAPDLSPGLCEQIRELGAIPLELNLDRSSINPISDLMYFARIHSALRRTHADLLITYTAKPNIWGGIAAKFAKVRSVSMVTGLGYAFTVSRTASIKRKFIQWAQKLLYRLATGWNSVVIFQNPDDRDDFVSFGCLADPTKAVVVNGSGVDLSKFRPERRDSGVKFVMISRLLRSKGLREYQEAAATIQRTHPSAQFVLAGFFDDGPDGISLSEVAALQASGVKFIGGLDDVRSILNQTSVFVLPSYREGTPRSVLEAMACGCAIITTDAPGCRETVVEGWNGFLVPVQDSAALAERIRWMIENPHAVALMGKNSSKMASEKYDVRKVNQAILDAIGV